MILLPAIAASIGGKPKPSLEENDKKILDDFKILKVFVQIIDYNYFPFF